MIQNQQNQSSSTRLQDNAILQEKSQLYHASSTMIQHSLKKTKYTIPIAKLGYKHIFVRNQKQLIIKRVQKQESKNMLNQFYQQKLKYQDGIMSFLKTYEKQPEDDIEMDIFKNSQQLSKKYDSFKAQEKQKDIRNYYQRQLSPTISKSSKLNKEGGYFFNNWRSYQNYYCSNGHNAHVQGHSLISRLVYAVFDMDYQMGLNIIDKITESQDKINSDPKVRHHISSQKQQNIYTNVPNNKCDKKSKYNLQLMSLKIILKGLKNICQIITICDQINKNSQLCQTFYNRQAFDILQDHYSHDPSTKINLLSLNLQKLQNISIRKQSAFYQSQAQIDQIYQEERQDYDQKYKDGMKNNIKKINKSTENLIYYKHVKKDHNLETIKKFVNLNSITQKVCLLANLLFLINFVKKIKIDALDSDYFKLIFTFLKNGKDQFYHIEVPKNHSQRKKDVSLKSNDDQIKIRSDQSESSHQLNYQIINFQQDVDYCFLLLNLKNIKIYDRINFATRLLPKQKKIKFVSEIGSKLVKLPYLDNLLFFTKKYKQQAIHTSNELSSDHFSSYYLKDQKKKEQNALRKRKSSQSQSKYFTQKGISLQKTSELKNSINKVNKVNENKAQMGSKMKRICQNYIDEYGDLSTVAYLSYQLQCLQKYLQYYRQSLLVSYQEQQLQKLQSLSSPKSSTFITQSCCSPISFFNKINLKPQKLNHLSSKQYIDLNVKRCMICSLKVQPYEGYMECWKCKHGGHLEHVVKWFNNYQNCPNVNCACICN